jgi:hypothetical protein
LEKLYCYVDESGQDTGGRYFIVVAVIARGDNEYLSEELEKAEKSSGRGLSKWHSSHYSGRVRYIESIAKLEGLQGRVYARVYFEGKQYLERTASVIADSIIGFANGNMIPKYRSTVIVDGLKEGEAIPMAKALRMRGLLVGKIRGCRDESSPIIRLADSIAGLVRDAHEGNAKLDSFAKRLKKRGILRIE